VKILIVDDNVDAAELLAMALDARGHQTRAVHDGAGALRAHSEWTADTVLLDLGLPDLDGYEVARRLQNSDHVPTIIALTGRAEMDEARSREAGFACHLLKPVTLEQLDKALKQTAAR
jgi:two-component system CheB/CheR fusion protein